MKKLILIIFGLLFVLLSFGQRVTDTNVLIVRDSSDFLDSRLKNVGTGTSASDGINLQQLVDSLAAFEGTTSLTADSIIVDVLTGATYDDVQAWLNTTQSAGIITGGEISDDLDGTVTIAAGNGIIKTTNSDIGDNLFFDWVQDATLVMTDNATNYIYVDYNSGTPTLNVTTTSVANRHTIYNFGQVYREGTSIDIINGGLRIEDFSKRVQQHHVEESALHFVSGAVVAETGTRNISITAGVMYAGLNRIATDAINTAVADDFEYYYYNGTVWVKSDQTQIDNLQYNDIATGLATLANNQYGVHWVYKGTNGDSYVLYGQGSYTFSEAEEVQIPASLPMHVEDFGVLRAKIIIQKSATVFTDIINATGDEFSGTTASDHNNLTGLDGGEAGYYGHITAAEQTEIGNISTTYVPYTGATTNVDLGTNTITGTQLISTIAEGTAPITVTSTTLVSNLNTDFLDGQDGSYYLDNATHTGDATGATALTLATVNSDIGTYNNVTINAKGLATAGSNIAYLTSFTELDPIYSGDSSYIKTHVRNDADLSITNEGQLSVAAGAATTSIINSNTSGQTGVTITAAGINTIAEVGNVITLTGTEVDGSTTNELNTTMSWNNSTNTVGVADAGGAKAIEITGFVNTELLGAANGVATLDASGLLPSSQVPTLAITNTEVFATYFELFTWSAAEVGDVGIVLDSSKTYILQTADYTLETSWKEILSPTDQVSSVNGETGIVTLSTGDIAEDVNFRYVSDAQEAIIDAAVTTLTTTGSSGVATKVGHTLNVPNYTLGGLGYSVPSLQSVTDVGSTTTNSISAGAGTFSGNVGIGTMSPSEKLDVIGNIQTSAESYIGPTSTTGMYFKDGNVGIGTASPSEKLDVVSTASGEGIFLGGDASPRLTISDTTIPSTFIAQMSTTDAFLGTTTSHGLTLGTVGAARMFIDITGNIGIGTTGPTEKLEVNGNITANTLISTIAVGTSPITVTSPTLVSNLNTDFLDGQHGSYYLDNVSTDLSEGVPTTTTVIVASSDGTDATLVSASTIRAGVLTKTKFDEIEANTLKTSGSTDHADLISNLDYASAGHTGFQATLPLTTEGDLLYRNGTTLARLPVGTPGSILSSNGTTVGWGSLRTDYISNITFATNTLTATGVGGAFNSTVGGIAGIGTANVFTENQTITASNSSIILTNSLSTSPFGGMSVFDELSSIGFQAYYSNLNDEGVISSPDRVKIVTDASERFAMETTGQMKLSNYTATSSFTGTAIGLLGFDSGGNITTEVIGSGGGDVTSVTGSTGIDASPVTGDVILVFDGNELPENVSTLVGTDEILIVDGATSEKEQIQDFDLDIFGSGAATNTHVLTADGSGGTDWLAQSGGGTPGGSDTYVQFNSSSSFGGDANFTFDGTNATVGGYVLSDVNRVQALTSAAGVIMHTTSGLKATMTLTVNTALTIDELVTGYEGTIEITNGATAYTLDIDGGTGYTTEKIMGNNAVIDPTVSSHTTVVYWRSGSTLYYGFIYDN